MSEKINKGDWQWFGQAGHFCNSDKCLFHLHTHVGRFCVSTVGEYFQLGRGNGIAGFEPQDLSANPGKYETMVFLLDEKCESPVNHRELEVGRCMTQDEANALHLEMCLRWEDREPPLPKNESEEDDE